MSPLANKLRPDRFTAMSPKMGAIVGHILGEQFTNPQIAEMHIDRSSGAVFARASNDIGFNDFIGSVSDLYRNWVNLLDCADLTPTERREADTLYTHHIERAS